MVRAKVPGFEPEEIDVQVVKNQITISGEHKVDPSGIEASHKNGVLKLSIPMAKEPESRKIEIKVN